MSAATPRIKKVLVYLFGSLGDTIVAIPALRSVKRNFPGAEIVLLQNEQPEIPVKPSEVLPSELVDRYLTYTTGFGAVSTITTYARLRKQLVKERFDAAAYLVLSERARSSVVRDRLFFRSCSIPALFGFHSFSKEELYPRDPDGRVLETDHEAIRKLRRLEMDGLKVDYTGDMSVPFLVPEEAELQKARFWLGERGFSSSDQIAALAPGCKTIANVWPLERFAEFGNYLMAEHGYKILIVGGRRERPLGDELIARWGSGANAAGAFSVRASAALTSLCRFYIGLDTGTTHLAAAVGTPFFAIFGERNQPGQWSPLGPGTTVHHPVPCAGCRLEKCPIAGHPCMHGISVDRVRPHLGMFISHLATDEPRAVSYAV